MLSLLKTMAQEYDYSFYSDPNTTDAASSGAAAGGALFFLLILLAFAVLSIVCMWRIFTKAGQPGWAAIVPIYNIYIWLKIVGREWWWLLLMLVPLVSIIVSIVITHDLSKSFGKGVGMTLLLIFLPFIGMPLLAFGDAKYQGPSVAGTGAAPHTPPAPTPPAAQTPTAPTPTV